MVDPLLCQQHCLGPEWLNTCCPLCLLVHPLKLWVGGLVVHRFRPMTVSGGAEVPLWRYCGKGLCCEVVDEQWKGWGFVPCFVMSSEHSEGVVSQWYGQLPICSRLQPGEVVLPLEVAWGQSMCALVGI